MLTLHFLCEDTEIGWRHRTSCVLHHEARIFEVLYPIIYASASMAEWGVQTNLEALRALVKDAYYSVDEPKENEDEGEIDVNKSDDQNAKRRERDEKRRERRERRQGMGDGKCSTDDLLDIVLYLWESNRTTARAQAEESKKRSNDEKVQNWLEQAL